MGFGAATIEDRKALEDQANSALDRDAEKVSKA